LVTFDGGVAQARPGDLAILMVSLNGSGVIGDFEHGGMDAPECDALL
jgi:hypothetical protein